jgi:hypothetical protein
MGSRALGLAAGVLLMAAGLAAPVQAQENLDAGKSPSQLFGGNCTACHKSPRGLLKTVAPGSLQGFLRQHYTTGPEMAGVLSSYLVSNGAGDTRYMGNQGKGAKEGSKDGNEAKSDAKPDGSASDQSERPSRRHRARSAEPAEAGQAAPASEAATGTDADAKQRHHGRKSAKRKRGRPAGDEAAKPDGMKEDSSDTAKPARDEKPSAEERSSERPRIEAPKESEPSTLRAEPAPSAAPATSPTTTQSIPSGGSDPSIPITPSH